MIQNPSTEFRPRVQLVSPIRQACYSTKYNNTSLRQKVIPGQLIGYQKNSMTYLQRTLMGAVERNSVLTGYQSVALKFS